MPGGPLDEYLTAWKWIARGAVVAGLAVTVSAIYFEPLAKGYVLEHNGSLHCPELQEKSTCEIFRPEPPPEKSALEIFAEWAPHFGPELIILGFASIFLELGLEKAKQKQEEDMERRQFLELLLRHVEDSNAFFTGDSCMTLETVRDRLLEIGEKQQKKYPLSGDELTLFNETS